MAIVRHLLVTCLLTLTATCWSGDATGDAPLADGAIADGAKLTAHWQASIYAKLWNDPALAALHDKFDANRTQAAVDLGFDPFEVLAALKLGGVRLLGISRNAEQITPQVVMEGDLGGFAAKVMQVIRAANPTAKDATVAGASEGLLVDSPIATAFARFNNLFLFAMGADAKALKPWKPVASDADLQLALEMPRVLAALRQALPAEQQASFDENTQLTARFLGTLDYQLTLVPEGMLEKWVNHAPPLATVPADRELLAKLPANALIALAYGVDGKAQWKAARGSVLKVLGARLGVASPDDAEKAIDQQLAAAGLTCTFANLVEGMQGTLIFAVTPSAPFPAVTIAIPRSPAFDQVMALMMKTLQVAAPGEGSAALLTIPNLPVPLQLAFDKSHWLITSDQQLPTTWLSGKPGGWAESPAGKLALSKAPKNASLIAASDTGPLLRTIGGLVGMALAANPAMDAKDKQAVMQGIAKAAALASTGYLVSFADGQKTVTEDRALIGIGALMPVAFGALMARAVVAQNVGSETTIARTLKGQVLKAEVQFQAGAYLDQDGDGIGEYGFLSELGGVRPTPNAKAGTLQLIDGALTGGSANGYDVAVFLPDGKGGALSDPAQDGPRPANLGAAKEQEKRYVVYAWPQDPSKGGRMLAMGSDGTVYVAPFAGQPPRWNELFGGKSWDAPPVWAPYRAGGPPPSTGPGKQPATKPGSDF